LVCWIVASFVAWRSVRFSGFFQTANRAPFSSRAKLEVALSPSLVPDLSADLVERVGGELHDVERIDAADRLRSPLGDRPADPGGHVGGDQLQCFAAFFAQRVEELKHRAAVAAGRGPHEATAVMVDHDGQVALSLAVTDLINGTRIVRMPPTLVVTRWS
jgi:hypothetical protein